MLGQNHNEPTAAFDWCLGIFDNRNQHVYYFRIVRVSERIQDLFFDSVILLGSVEGHQIIDRLFAAATADGADRSFAQLDVVCAAGSLQQLCSGARTLSS